MPAAGPSSEKTPLYATRSPSLNTVPPTTLQDLPLSAEQISSTEGMVITLGYHDIPCLPLHTLRILRETCRCYNNGQLSQALTEHVGKLHL